MNQFEASIFDAVRDAHRQYEEMTAGWWLQHAPESFIHVVIAQHLNAQGYNVYIDASNQKLRDGHVGLAGKIAKDPRKRPDISVWYKSTGMLKAEIEVKKAHYRYPIDADITKLSGCINTEGHSETGYVVAYSQSKNHLTTLKKRFESWADNKAVKYQVHDLSEDIDSKGWGWGCCIIRI